MGYVIAGVVVVVLVVAFIGIYNGLVRLRNRADNAWAQVDVQLKRRYDLIPNLVETVKGYAAHEQSTFEQVVEARNRAVAAGTVVFGISQIVWGILAAPVDLAITMPSVLAGLAALSLVHVMPRLRHLQID